MAGRRVQWSAAGPASQAVSIAQIRFGKRYIPRAWATVTVAACLILGRVISPMGRCNKAHNLGENFNRSPAQKTPLFKEEIPLILHINNIQDSRINPDFRSNINDALLDNSCSGDKQELKNDEKKDTAKNVDSAPSGNVTYDGRNYGNPAEAIEPDWYGCEYSCGYVGTFSETSLHEIFCYKKIVDPYVNQMGRQSMCIHIESCRAYSVVSQARRLKRLIQNKIPFAKVDINKRCVDRQPREGIFEILANGEVIFTLQNLAPPYTWFVREFDMEELANDILQAVQDESVDQQAEQKAQELAQANDGRPRMTTNICMYCGKDFLTADVLRIHMRLHSHFKAFKCQICFKAFTYNLVLQTHLKTHALCKPYRCDFCGKLFVSPDDMRTHIRLHTYDKRNACEFCGRNFANIKFKEKHRGIHRGEHPFMCENCGRTFPSLVVFERHHICCTAIWTMSSREKRTCIR
mmetsp:Transcript_3162/g.7360  ORF Transcript_3162/g.7360 Transcript_3162/m.7360 type:complete len:463 (+) Transcript_3162:183-1571(+)